MGLKLKSFEHITAHVFRGRVFQIFWRRPPVKPKEPNTNYVGYCDSDKQKMWIGAHDRNNVDPLDLALTAAHEPLHACIPDIDDDCVDEWEKSVRTLWKEMGIEIHFHPKGSRKDCPHCKAIGLA